MSWKTLDTQSVVRRSLTQTETTSASVGSFAVPLVGQPMRPLPIKPYETLKIKKT
jgi:hypothetical protein